MNRQELRKRNAVHTTNVTPDEKRLLAAFESSKTQQSSAMKEVAAANAEVRRAIDTPEKLIVAKQKLKDTTEASAAADKARKDAEVAWNTERDKNEPDEVRRFRGALIKCKCVAQLFDPWFMDSNTHDTVVATPNMQLNENEKLHAHHLHITVYEPKIL
jgi:hypothetical protein